MSTKEELSVALISPGSLFELEEAELSGVTGRVHRKVPVTLKAIWNGPELFDAVEDSGATIPCVTRLSATAEFKT